MKLLTAMKYLLIFSLFAGMGCKETILEQTFTVGEESTFRVNQIYTSSDGQYTFQINEINDSRCPEGVVCFWSGEVAINCEWIVNKNRTIVELHSVLKDQQKEPGGFSIQIVDVKPYPKFGTINEPKDLVITLLISKKLGTANF
ncbi:MAG: hypothetical protein K0M40_18205 [Prolixibacteraceae bacterium]|nr:hypothetical protein [Prolixibacteraceae bacterium]